MSTSQSQLLPRLNACAVACIWSDVLIIVCQGLFHGFVLLPLALSTFGASHPDDLNIVADSDANPHADDAPDPTDAGHDDSSSSTSTTSCASPVDSPVHSPQEEAAAPRMFEEEGGFNDLEQDPSQGHRQSKGKQSKSEKKKQQSKCKGNKGKNKRGGERGQVGTVAFENPVIAFEDEEG
eukprot:COSAG06_NODE_727_length_12752_cov_61.232277_7_plen_180_part_00